jgi:hexokinase
MTIDFDTYTTFELTKITQRFFKELLWWEQGKSRDFSYLKTKITSSNLVTDAQQFQIMTIGGSNFTSAIGSWQDGKLKLANQVKTTLPIFETKEIFLEFIHNQINLNLEIISINFGYPVENFVRQGRLDATLLRATKEHSFTGLVGENIGQEIEKYIEQKSGKKVQVVVANDIVCLLNSFETTQNSAAMIVGTGFNLGFYENNTTVNLESGNFSGFRQSETGVVIDKNSANPGKQQFEKEVAGAYLYRHYNILAKRYGLAETQSTVTLSDIATNGVGDEAMLAQKLFDRSAALVACQLAGLYYFRGEEPMTWIVEGGIFYKSYKYQTSLKKYLKKLEVDLENIQFVKPQNAFLGAAKLVC